MWNEYGSINNENHFDQQSSTTLRNTFINSNNKNNNNYNRDRTTTSRSVISNQGAVNNNNNNKRAQSGDRDKIYFENSDSQGNPILRPLEKNYNTRQTTTPTSVNSYTTRKENYFPGDLPFINAGSTVS